MIPATTETAISRRRFLRQTLGFSAAAGLGSLSSVALPPNLNESAADLFMLGDWGYDSNHAAQAGVAKAMRIFGQQSGIHTQALLLLGDNWYGALEGGAQSARWQT